MPVKFAQELRNSSDVRKSTEAALEAGGGLLRLAPSWVPRSFLQPGKRLKLHPADLYAFGPIAAASTSAGSRRQRRRPTRTARPTKG